MVVAALCVSLRMDGCENLKDKRRILRSLFEKLRRSFGLAVAEVGDQDLWNVAEIGVSCVSNNVAHAESQLQHALDMIDSRTDVSIEGVEKLVDRL